MFHPLWKPLSLGSAIVATGRDEEILRLRGPKTKVIDGNGRTVIRGLNDSHMHPIRGGLNYNMELRWDGVSSLADALRILKDQAARTPAPQWVRVVGGWTEFQFAERRMPMLDEINEAAPDMPVCILHLYDRALLNAAALRAGGYDKNAPDFPAGEVQRDRHGNPTGVLVAKPNANILYSTLAKGPKRRTRGRYGQARPDHGTERHDWDGRRGPRPLRHAARWCPNRPQRVVGRALDPGPRRPQGRSVRQILQG